MAYLLLQRAVQSVNKNSQDLAEEYCWLEGGQDYVVCAFYTPDYAAHALELRRSLEALSINHFLKCYEPAGSWEANTRIKPKFIAHCLSTLSPKHVLYVDADAIVKQPLTLLDDISTDLAVCLRQKRQRPQIAVGTLYVRNTPAGRRIVEEWTEATKECGQFAKNKDSEFLRRVVERSTDVSITVLPDTYRKTGNRVSSKTVIHHFSVGTQKHSAKKFARKRTRVALVLAAFLLVWWYFLFYLWSVLI